MNNDIKLECIKLAAPYSTNTEDLIKNAEKLFEFIKKL